MPTRKRRIKHAAIVDAFAERLRSIRAAREMTQRDLAHRAHVTITYVSRLEAGGAAPGIDLLERLAQALQVHVTDLLPPAALPGTSEAHRQEVKALCDSVLARAGRETLSMVGVLLNRLSESPAVSR